MKTCAALFTYGVLWFFGVEVGGICVNLCVVVPGGILLCVSCSSWAHRDGPAPRPADGLLSIVDRLTWWE